MDKQKQVNDLCNQAKTQYYTDKITSVENDSKQLFKVSNSLLHKTTPNTLPTHVFGKRSRK